MSYQLGSIRKIVSGEGCISELPEIIKSMGAQAVEIITDDGVYKLGLTRGAEECLKDAGIKVHVIHDVPPEPSYEQVEAIYEQARAHECDAIVAIGGGSSMDTSKLVALMLTNAVTLREMIKGAKPTVRGVPTVMVPTTSGTGSEATPNAIVLVPEEQLKVGIVSDLMICDVAILDPVLTVGLPPHITANTGIDALCHLMECYISRKNNPLSESFSLHGIKLAAKSLRKCYQDPKDMKARELMQVASTFGGIAIASSGTTAIHALSYPLGGRYHIPHGLANAILMPQVMDVNKSACIHEYAVMAKAMELDCADRSEEECADIFVQELYALNRDLKIHLDFKAKGITLDVVDELVEAASKVTRLLNNNPKELTKEEMREIYIKVIKENS